eukprot:3506871-Amphidinium_carterae.1
MGENSEHSPTPPVEVVMMFMQAVASLGFDIAVADIKQAFLQSDPLERQKGPFLVEPCEGLPLKPGSLIELKVAVYGLDDASWKFRRSLIKHLKTLGLRRTVLDPCFWIEHDDKGAICRMVLLDVDDLIMATNKSDAEKFKVDIERKFKLGKYEESNSSFCGRRIRCYSDHLALDMEKYIYIYIVEDLQVIPLSRVQKRDKEARLDENLMKELRSLIYKLNWIGREARPEVWGIPWERLHLVTFSDAGGVMTKDVGKWHEDSGPTDATQGAWLVFACDGLPKDEREVRLSPLMWKSAKLKRKVPSTLAGEALALGEAVSSVEWCQMMFRDIKKNDLSSDFGWDRSCGPFAVAMSPDSAMAGRLPQGHTIHAKSVFDALQREAAGCKADRRAAVDLALIHGVMERTGAIIKWVRGLE